MSTFHGAAQSLATRYGVRTGTIFDCFAKVIDPEVTIPSHMAEYVTGEPVRGNGLRGSVHVAEALSSFLHWCALIDRGSCADGDAPYESLIRFFEQGGRIYVEHGVLLEVNENRKHAFGIRVPERAIGNP
jgi:hypothetical protein